MRAARELAAKVAMAGAEAAEAEALQGESEVELKVCAMVSSLRNTVMQHVQQVRGSGFNRLACKLGGCLADCLEYSRFKQPCASETLAQYEMCFL